VAVFGEYHFQEAPVPKVPAETLNVALAFGQTLVTVAAAVGFVEGEPTVICNESHGELPQAPSPRT
jgi:hypothetical protein